MKVAILYFGNGQSFNNWHEFHRSAERYFMPEADRHFFVFGTHSGFQPTQPNVTIVQATLFTETSAGGYYQRFLQIEKRLAEFDYVYSFDSSCRFVREIGAEFLPEESNQLVMVQHPRQVNIPVDRVPYERNPRSRASIRSGQGQCYVTGRVQGGSSSAFLSLARAVRDCMQDDANHGIAAVRSEESYLNRYLIEHSYTLRHAGYCYPQSWSLGLPKLIEIRSQSAHRGSADRGPVTKWLPGRKSRRVNRVTVALSGDLGEQLFQYAAGRALAERRDCPLYLDSRSFDADPQRQYALGEFSIRAQIARHRWVPPGKINWRKLIGLQSLLSTRQVVHQRSPGFDPSPLSEQGDTLLQGYWQNEKYFQEIDDQLRSELKFRTPLPVRSSAMLELINSQSSLAVHVQCSQKAFSRAPTSAPSELPADYYNRAIQQVQRRTGEVPTLFLFSQDVHWAATQITIDCPRVLVRENDYQSQYETLVLMAACEHQVISRSATAWWAAWLNRNPDKQVIAPRDNRPEVAQLAEPCAARNWLQLDFAPQPVILSRAA